MIQILVAAIGIWLVWQCVQAFRRQWGSQATAASAPIAHYLLSPEQNWALALAHPMAFHALKGGFADSDMPAPTTSLAASLRPMALHAFGLRTDLDDAQVRAQLPERMRTRWWCLDVERLQAGEDARAAMAFACARTSFFVRTAAMLGWISPEQQWQLLQLNAARARDCFGSWQEFAVAYTQGRAQWVAKGRSDALGRNISPEELQQWLRDTSHPWGAYAWR